jgi:hypothetical protein
VPGKGLRKYASCPAARAYAKSPGRPFFAVPVHRHKAAQSALSNHPCIAELSLTAFFFLFF